MAVGAEYDAGGNILRRLESLVNRGSLLQGSHEPGSPLSGGTQPRPSPGVWPRSFPLASTQVPHFRARRAPPRRFALLVPSTLSNVPLLPSRAFPFA